MGERGDGIRTMQRALTTRNLERMASELAVLEPGDARLVGRVVEGVLSDELQERHDPVVDGVDGRTRYAEVGRVDAEDPVRAGSAVALTPSAGRGPTQSVRIERLGDRATGGWMIGETSKSTTAVSAWDRASHRCGESEADTTAELGPLLRTAASRKGSSPAVF